MWGKRNLYPLFVVMLSGLISMENCIEIPQKSKNTASIYPEITFHGIYLQSQKLFKK